MSSTAVSTLEIRDISLQYRDVQAACWSYLKNINSRAIPGIPLMITDALRWHFPCRKTPLI